jgi:hypothetical protein
MSSSLQSLPLLPLLPGCTAKLLQRLEPTSACVQTYYGAADWSSLPAGPLVRIFSLVVEMDTEPWLQRRSRCGDLLQCRRPPPHVAHRLLC